MSARSSPNVGLAAEEALMLPAVEHRQQRGAAVGGEAARGAGDGAEQRLAALDHAEGDEVAHLLHPRQEVRGLVQHLGVPDDGADALVGEVGDEQGEPVGLDDGVGVDEDADLAARAADALRHAGPLAAILREADAHDLRVALAGGEHVLPRRVGRPVVDDDDLEPIGGVVAHQARVDRRLDARLLVEGRDHDRARGAVARVGCRPVERREREAGADVEGHAQRVRVEERIVEERGEAAVLRDPDPVDEHDRVEHADELQRA